MSCSGNNHFRSCIYTYLHILRRSKQFIYIVLKSQKIVKIALQQYVWRRLQIVACFTRKVWIWITNKNQCNKKTHQWRHFYHKYKKWVKIMLSNKNTHLCYDYKPESTSGKFLLVEKICVTWFFFVFNQSNFVSNWYNCVDSKNFEQRTNMSQCAVVGRISDLLKCTMYVLKN